MRTYFVDVLSKEEKLALSKSGISLKDVFIHPHIAVNWWPGIMRALGMLVAWGPPCKKGRHRLRSRSNHCIICSPKSLSFQKRFSDPAIVYVANSLNLNLVKVGISDTLQNRIKQLNNQRLGGVTDWSVQFQVKCDNAGRVEARAHRVLKAHRSQTHFATRSEISRETFRYPVEKVVQIVKSLAERSAQNTARVMERPWSAAEIATVREEVAEFKEYLAFIHNPYRNDFNLLYDLYYEQIGSRPLPEGEIKFAISKEDLETITSITCLPQDFLRAWPKSPKFNNGVLKQFIG